MLIGTRKEKKFIWTIGSKLWLLLMLALQTALFYPLVYTFFENSDLVMFLALLFGVAFVTATYLFSLNGVGQLCGSVIPDWEYLDYREDLWQAIFFTIVTLGIVVFIQQLLYKQMPNIDVDTNIHSLYIAGLIIVAFLAIFSGLLDAHANKLAKYTEDERGKARYRKLGRKDGKDGKEKQRTYQHKGESYFCTEKIQELVANFEKEVIKQFQKFSNELSELKQSISDCKDNGQKIVDTYNAGVERIKEKVKIALSIGDNAKVQIYMGSILRKHEKMIGDVDFYNTNGCNNANKHNKIVADYKSYFNAELQSCFEKIRIYWSAFCDKYKECAENESNKENIELATDILKDKAMACYPTKETEEIKYTRISPPIIDNRTES
jgi:hypothetical protein